MLIELEKKIKLLNDEIKRNKLEIKYLRQNNIIINRECTKLKKDKDKLIINQNIECNKLRGIEYQLLVENDKLRSLLKDSVKMSTVAIEPVMKDFEAKQADIQSAHPTYLPEEMLTPEAIRDNLKLMSASLSEDSRAAS